MYSTMHLSSFYAPWYSAMSLPFITLGITLIMGLVLWSVVWKGMGLWRAAQNGDKAWFVVLLLINTLGILEILYIYVFGKKKN